MRVRGFRTKTGGEPLFVVTLPSEKMYYAVRNFILHFFSQLGNVFKTFL